ncbi:GNAT family N-acetyltransferase [Maricaulis sp.]|uniref:GNAT family N-acetyltransferase n=1 Tax=Maricaulis sp. TaxID=1486257 RepID=UPI002613DEB6|nr:GNAT family N-acetyltransferase [Maricaulis sp.]
MTQGDTKLIRPSELTSAERQAWQDFVAADARLASPYFAPDFAECCEEARSDTRVAVYRRHGAIKAFLPMQTGRFGFARPIGGPLGDVHGVIAEPGADIQPSLLLEQAGIALFEFKSALAEQPGFARAARSRDGSWMVDTRAGFDAWRDNRRSVVPKLIKNLDMRRRRLERFEAGHTLRLSDARPEAFATLVDWKSAQYRRTGVFDAFRVGWTQRLLAAVLKRQTPRFSGILSTLSVDGRLAALHLGMVSDRMAHFWFPAYHADFSRISPGLLLLEEFIRMAADLGLEAVELGPGDYGFKQELASYQRGLASGFLAPSPSRTWVHNRLDNWVERLDRIEAQPARWPGKALRRLDEMAGFYAL